jgi:hemerythrin-like domain-containing protein
MKITDALVAEHTIFLVVFDEIEQVLPSLTTPAEIRTMARVMERMLHSHAARENNLAFIALDHAIAEKGHLERMYQDHQEIDSRLGKVHTTATCAESRRLVKAAIAASREHFALEERFLFPMLEKTLHSDTLNDLGRNWIERKTHPTPP